MSQTVLVADDSKTIREIVEMALKASAWEVVSAGSADEAVRAAQNSPSVILLDYYMGPNGSGYDICRQLKADVNTSSIPVVMLGGSYQSFDEDLARQSGADGVLMKPFNTDALITAIEDAKANGASAAPSMPEPAAPEPASTSSSGLPVPQPYFDEESEASAASGDDAYGDSDGYGDSDAYGDSEPEIEPVYEPPAAAESEPESVHTDATPLPQPHSQPRIPADPPQARQGSSPDIGAARQPAPSSGAVGGGMSRAEIESMIKEEVRATVRSELPGLLRTVMGEIFQQKVLPKLLQHAEQRVQSAVSENLSAQIQNQVRVELERLLEE